MECKESYKGLTVRLKLDGTEELEGLLVTAKELEATLERVTSLIERISSSSDGKKSSVREVSERLYELERKSAQTDGAYHGLDIRLSTRGADGEVRL